MSFILRISLAMLLFGLSMLILMYPNESRTYINERYTQFHKYLYSTLPLPRLLSAMLISKAATWEFQAFGILVAIGGLIMLYNRRFWVYVCAYMLAIPGAILHMPYEGSNAVAQIRKLAFIFAMFLCAIVLGSLEEEKKTAAPEKEVNKTK